MARLRCLAYKALDEKKKDPEIVIFVPDVFLSDS
jgi:hypothetical protein